MQIALQYKFQVCCGVSLASKGSEASKAQQLGGRAAVQIGGVLPIFFQGA